MKLIFFDIDGTLINGGHDTMPLSAVEAIREARRRGDLCIVNTGRTACIVDNWLPALAEFDGYLYGCGTQIVFRGKELMHKTFSEKEGEAIIDGLRKYHIDAILEGAGNNYLDDLDDMFTLQFRRYIERHYKDKNWGHISEACGNFDKFFCCGEWEDSVIRFAEEYKELLTPIDRGRGFYELVPAGLSKATGMEYLANYLHVSMEDTVAIGDSNNDLAMLSCAHTAIAMGNANDTVKEMAHYVTTTVENDGIRNALNWLAKRTK